MNLQSIPREEGALVQSIYCKECARDTTWVVKHHYYANSRQHTWYIVCLGCQKSQLEFLRVS